MLFKKIRNFCIVPIVFFIIFTRCASVKSVISRVPGFPDYKNDKDIDAQAVSKPGFIGVGARKRFVKIGQGDIACTVDVIDPTPDNNLGHDETITFVVTIRNFSLDIKIHPKLEISSYYNNNPHMLKIFLLNALNPGEKTEFKENIVWDRNIADKLIKYKFRAFDNITNSSSLVMEKEIMSVK